MPLSSGLYPVCVCPQGVPLPMPDRAWLMARLRAQGLDPALAAWLASSTAPLQPPPGGSTGAVAGSGPQAAGAARGGGAPLGWSFDVQGAAAMYTSYRWAVGRSRAKLSHAPATFP